MDEIFYHVSRFFKTTWAALDSCSCQNIFVLIGNLQKGWNFFKDVRTDNIWQEISLFLPIMMKVNALTEILTVSAVERWSDRAEFSLLFLILKKPVCQMMICTNRDTKQPTIISLAKMCLNRSVSMASAALPSINDMFFSAVSLLSLQEVCNSAPLTYSYKQWNIPALLKRRSANHIHRTGTAAQRILFNTNTETI